MQLCNLSNALFNGNSKKPEPINLYVGYYQEKIVTKGHSSILDVEPRRILQLRSLEKHPPALMKNNIQGNIVEMKCFKALE